MICNSCGNYVNDEAKFCPYCGNPTENTSARQTAGTDTAGGGMTGEYAYGMPGMASESAKPKKSKKFLIPVIAAVIVIGVLAAIFIPKLVKKQQHGSAQKVAERFTECFSKGDVDKLAEYVHPSTSEDMVESMSYMTEYMKMITITLGDIDYYDEDEVEEFNDEYRTGFEGVCEIECEMSAMGMSMSVTSMYLVKDGGSWYVYFMD